MSLKKKIKELVDNKIKQILDDIINRSEDEYHDIIMQHLEALDAKSWIELPDYPLMQFQKDEINEAISKILNGQKD